MAFTPLQYDSGKLVTINATSGETYAKGDALTFVSGYAALATAGQGADVTHIAMQDKVAASGDIDLLAIAVQGVRFEADCDAAWSVVDVGTYADIATKATLNPDASADDLFFIEKGVGVAETGTKVQGYFVHGAPNS